jgi:branched-chain amino acid aminotransferase
VHVEVALDAVADGMVNGITRGNVIRLCHEQAIPVFERDFSLADVYGSDEAFVTGTFGGLTPVAVIDGRSIGDRLPGPLTLRAARLRVSVGFGEGMSVH